MTRANPACGTYAALVKHRRMDEPVDDHCRWIGATYMELRRWERGEAVRGPERILAGRRDMALRILAGRHQAELDVIVDDLRTRGLPKPDPAPTPRAPRGSILGA